MGRCVYILPLLGVKYGAALLMKFHPRFLCGIGMLKVTVGALRNTEHYLLGLYP